MPFHMLRRITRTIFQRADQRVFAGGLFQPFSACKPRPFWSFAALCGLQSLAHYDGSGRTCALEFSGCQQCLRRIAARKLGKAKAWKIVACRRGEQHQLVQATLSRMLNQLLHQRTTNA